MKYIAFPIVLLAIFAGGCAHNTGSKTSASQPAACDASGPMIITPTGEGSFMSSFRDFSTRDETVQTGSEPDAGIPEEKTDVLFASNGTMENESKVEADDNTGPDTIEEEDAWEEDLEAEDPGIADPLESFNRAMFHFNDKLYFRVLKPVAQGYNKVMPKPARSGIQNFFENLKFPIRFVNNLLQANFRGAISEAGRFTVNTLWGVGGFLDPASKKELDIPEYDADFGQTLGVYGVGAGFYIVWPILGPSSARDTVEIPGDYFLYPVSYISPGYASSGTRVYETVNDTSLRIGDYELLKEAAIDPYVALRNAYVQYREEKIKTFKKIPLKPGGVR
ncbi:MAG: VacJ family lipoprotein [Desulfobacterales bacterium]|nr:VacJ family lipoprotein [Desulfobacterales bacterium]MDD4071503.1 VacJ family lipoprotein [Desulfobacterales bacterium]MDD4392944.1 VacJ family lipoprotein [Desulfobacterales bacterium]